MFSIQADHVTGSENPLVKRCGPGTGEILWLLGVDCLALISMMAQVRGGRATSAIAMQNYFNSYHEWIGPVGAWSSAPIFVS